MNRIASRILQKILENKVVRKLIQRPVGFLFHSLIVQKTNNFSDVEWLGDPIWQNVFDLWNTQEVISMLRPELIIECGTNRAGSAIYYAQLMDLLEIEGKVVSIDIEKLHDRSHPKVTFLIGSSVSDEMLDAVEGFTQEVLGPVLVILDSNHDYEHVLQELDRYHRFVTKDSYLSVQDGCIDVIPHFRSGRPGPLPAIEKFVSESSEFVVDTELCERFLITHHPKGWLKKIGGDAE